MLFLSCLCIDLMLTSFWLLLIYERKTFFLARSLLKDGVRNRSGRGTSWISRQLLTYGPKASYHFPARYLGAI